jgi:hypothetical protein
VKPKVEIPMTGAKESMDLRALGLTSSTWVVTLAVSLEAGSREISVD